MPKPNDPLDFIDTVMPREKPPEPVLVAGATLDKYCIVCPPGRECGAILDVGRAGVK